jgi:hypothetical protein
MKEDKMAGKTNYGGESKSQKGQISGLWGITIILCVAILVGGVVWYLVFSGTVNITGVNTPKISTSSSPSPSPSSGRELTNCSKAEAVIIVKNLPEVQDYLARVPNGIVEYDSEDKEAGVWVIHVYEIVENGDEGHTATFDWYNVNKSNCEAVSIFD